jgi:hypothetical protein
VGAESTQKQSGIEAFRLVGEAEGRAIRLRLGAGETALGSGVDCGLVIRGRQVSRRHAVVVVDGRGVQLQDLGSKNGTFVNGVRVNRARLKEGDWLQLGEVILTLEAVPSDEDRLAVSLETPQSSPASESPMDLTTEIGRNHPPRLSPALLLGNAEESRLEVNGDLDLGRAVAAVERRLVGAAVARAGGNLAAAARLLGVTRNGLVMKLERLGLGRRPP